MTRPPSASVEAAFVAALPASTQPSSATTTVGSFSSGMPRRSLYRLTKEASGLRPARRRRADDPLVVPVGANRREYVDDDGALRSGHHVVGPVAEDPPRPAGTEVARLAVDREVHLAANDHAQLLGRVTVLGHDGVGPQLHDRERDPFALDASRADLVAPDLEERQVGKVLEAAHGSSGGAPIAGLSRAGRRAAATRSVPRASRTCRGCPRRAA